MTKTLLLLPGDGIGPEVTAQSHKVVEHLIDSVGLDLRIEQALRRSLDRRNGCSDRS